MIDPARRLLSYWPRYLIASAARNKLLVTVSSRPRRYRLHCRPYLTLKKIKFRIITLMKPRCHGIPAIGQWGGDRWCARYLPAFQEVKQSFPHLIKYQVERSRLEENEGSILLAKKDDQTVRGGHNRIEIYLAIEANKHILCSPAPSSGNVPIRH